jgi:hypothetical protein
MRKIILAAIIGLSLAGCSNMPKLDLSNSVTLNTMLSVESAYGVALSGERAYKALPLCRTGVPVTVTNPCAKRSVIVNLQAADRKVISAIRQANTFIKTYPTVDASNLISAASAAVSSLQSILAQNGVQ